MSSRIPFGIGVMTLAVVTVTGCTPRLGEKPPEPVVMEFDGTACLSEAAKTVRSFIFGEAKDQEVSQSWDCLIGAFDSFRKYVRGQSKDHYTPAELAKFFEDNFFEPSTSGEPRIGVGLQTELMKFKQMFVGGSVEFVTRDELIKTLAVFRELRGLTLRINPEMPVLLGKWSPPNRMTGPEQDLPRFEQSNRELQSVARELGLLIEKNGISYQLDDFLVFFSELSSFYGESWSWVDAVRRYLPVAKKVKKALAGGEEDRISPLEWPRILLLSGRGYVQYLRYTYFLEPEEVTDRAVRLGFVARTMEDAFSVFEDLVQQKESGEVARAEMNEIFEALSLAWPAFRFSEALSLEFMKIKRVFFGGRIDAWTVRDFETARLTVDGLRSHIARLLPYTAIYTVEWNPGTMTPEEVERRLTAAGEALRSSLVDFGRGLRHGYDMKDLQAFMREWNRLYPSRPEATLELSDAFERALPVVERLKNVVFQQNDSVIQMRDWPALLGYLSGGFRSYLYYEYLLKGRSRAEPGVSVRWRVLLAQGLDLFKEMLVGKPRPDLSGAELTEVLGAIRLVWPQAPASGPLSEEFLALKAALFGGPTDRLVPGDLDVALAGLPEFGRIFDDLTPYVDVFDLSWNPPADPVAVRGRLNTAREVLLRSAQVLAVMIRGDYDSNRLAVLAREWRLSAGVDSTVPETIEKYLPALQRLKNLIFSDNDTIVRRNQWPSLLGDLVRGYGLFLEHEYLLKGRDRRDPDVRSSWDGLLADGVGLLRDLVGRRPSGALGRAEFNDLLVTVQTIAPGVPISRGFSDEILALKVLLAGGSADQLTSVDLENLRTQVSGLLGLYSTIEPYLDVYSMEWRPDSQTPAQADRRFQAAAEALRRAASQLGGLVRGDYDSQRLFVLLREWRSGSRGSSSAEDMLRKYLPLVQKLKNLLFAESGGTVIRRAQWRTFAPLMGRGYGAFLEYSYFLEGKKDPLRSEPVLNRWRSWTPSSLDLLRDFVAAKADGPVTRSQLMGLIRDLQGAGFVPRDWQLDGLEDVVRVVLGRMLVPVVERLMGRGTDTLTVQGVDILKQNASAYLYTQGVLLSVFGGRTDRVMTDANLRDRFTAAARASGADSTARKALTDLVDVLRSPVAMVLDGRSRWIITPRARPGYNLVSMERHNLLRVVGQFFVSSYAAERPRIESGAGVTQEEAERAFREFRRFAIQRGFLEPENATFMRNRFREANIFMPRADGDQLASRLEIHELMFAIMSGIGLDGVLKGELRRVCTTASGMMQARGKLVRSDCLLAAYRRAIAQHMGATPELLRFQQGVPAATFDAFFANAVKGTGGVVDANGYVKLEDVGLIPHVLQYIELIFARFDADSDMGIRVPEARVAFPAFRSLFRELARRDIESGRIAEKDLLALFTYILRYGQPPSGIWEGLTRWYPWKDNPGSWEHYADRSRMAQIIGFIADQVNAANAAPLVAPSSSQVRPPVADR